MTRLRCIFAFVHAFFNKRHLEYDCCTIHSSDQGSFWISLLVSPSVLPGLVWTVLHVFVLGGFGQVPSFSDLELPEQRGNKGCKNNKPTFGLFDVQYILREETNAADHDSHCLDETDNIIIDARLWGHPPI